MATMSGARRNAGWGMGFGVARRGVARGVAASVGVLLAITSAAWGMGTVSAADGEHGRAEVTPWGRTVDGGDGGTSGERDETGGSRVRTPSGVETNRTLFSPLDLPAPNAMRTVRGEPGPAYWQNLADYELDARLDEKNRRVEGSMTVRYTNRSPERLDALWFHLDQNLYRLDSDGSRMTRPGDRYGNLHFDGGFTIRNVRFESGEEAKLDVYGTIGRVGLMHELRTGESVSVRMDFGFEIPPYGSDRMGIRECRDGEVFEIAQWFPQVCKFDDVRGWNTLPYLGDGEFYTDFGIYTARITVPAGHVVAATGVLQNAESVLSAEELARYRRAISSAEPVEIRTTDEAARAANEGEKTWEFSARYVRTFAWASSKAFAWDGCKLAETEAAPREEDAILRGMGGARGMGTEGVFCQSFYPRESAGMWGVNGDKGGSTRMLRDSIRMYAAKWMGYAYPTASNVAGVVSGMEYPMIIFCNADEDEEGLWGVTTHEIGHTWFPMVVNTDERRYAWMDEGFNTFMNAYATEEWDSSFLAREEITRFGRRYSTPLPQPSDTPADHLGPRLLGITQYDKPAVGLLMLREGVVGPERFDRAFRAYMRKWAFKSPQPADFFRCMEDGVGMDLAWFWRGWLMQTGVLDQAVTTVMQAGGSSGEGESKNARVTFKNLGAKEGRNAMIAPLTYRVDYTDGTSEVRGVPVEVWSIGNEWQATWDTKGRRIKEIEVDPEGVLPDADRRNNRWTR